jgi:PKD repeat protein
MEPVRRPEHTARMRPSHLSHEIAMGLFALLARFLPRLARRERKPQFAYVPLAPRRLERRRVFDAAGAGLMLEAIPDAEAFVQTAEFTTGEEQAPQEELVAAVHGGPHATLRLRDAELFEDQSTLAVINISDSSPTAHQVTIDWGDGSPATVINAGANQRDVLAVHKYLDDPAGPGDGSFTVTATVTNTLGESTTTSATILVKNGAPKIDSLTMNSPINESSTATLTGTYSDVGTLDTHTLDIDWNGDGTFDQSVAVTGSTISVSRQILDDNPTGTTSDTFNVNVRLRDDDGGEATGAVPLTVRNVSPSITALAVTSPVVENGTATLTGSYVDAGTQDTHTLDLDWNGDGTFDQTVAVSGGSFSVTRQFLDDDPTGTSSDTFNVNVRLRDDDGGTTLAATVLTVRNANPVVVLDPGAISIFENGTAVLSGTYNDVGSLDSHELDIDWDGDGAFDETIAVSGGAFTVTRQFFDDNPTGTRFDKSIVTVRLRDDDGGVGTDTASLEVRNANPAVALVPPSAIVENGIATFNGTITDIGTLDTFTLLVSWGDPASPDDLQTFDLGTTALTKAMDGIDWDPTTRQFSVDHQYLDDNPTGSASDTYDVLVAVVDDDTGAAVARTSVTVQNAAPVLTGVSITSPIVENGTATLTGAYIDPGTEDTHELDIDWDGDGTFDQTVTVTGGSFSVSRQFLDDNPSGTLSDTFSVNVRLRDDDGGVDTDSKSLTIRNVNPVLTLISPSAIDEDESATLNGSISDVGTLDTFTLVVVWGDPASPNNTQTFDLGSTTLTKAVDGIDWEPTTRQFSIDHQYLDDNPSGTAFNTYAIQVAVADDDGGADLERTSVTVRNVDLTLQVAANQTVDEGAMLDLTGGALGSFTDEGTLDTHTATVNWGDGSGDQVVSITEANGSGTLGGSHIFADNGVYTVRVTVVDDDGGRVTETFSVTVENVDPTLTGVDTPIAVEEGNLVTLSSLGVGLADPGFDNPSNPLTPGGSQETLTAVSVDWGDGTTVQTLTIAGETDGGPNTPTSATFSHAAHAFADDGTYTVTVIVRDDDGAEVSRTFTIVVNNVDPSLDLTNRFLEINEGEVLDLADLGTFEDPGFNNPSNPNGASVESFHYSIDWGDGTLTENNQAPASLVDGRQGVKTTGTLADSHSYLDNDEDNQYTITVTLFDDDGGSVTEQIQVRVLNVNPTLSFVGATDVTAGGFATFTLSFDDPGTERVLVHIDWGDAKPDAIWFDPSPTAVTHTFVHRYDGPPNPANPAAPITIKAFVTDDDFGVPGVVEPGLSNEVSAVIRSPGIGAEPFRIDTTPRVPQLTFPVREVPLFVANNSGAAFTAQQTFAVGGSSGEALVGADRYIELRVIDAEGNEGPGYRLRPEVLADLPGLFRSLPDNHYAVYVVNTETNTRRLVIEVYVRNGKLIDPGDDSEGTRDRPPTDAKTTEPVNTEPTEDEPVQVAPDGEPGAATEPVFPETLRFSPWTALAVGLAASSSAQSWAHRVDESLSKATAEQWRKLQGHNPPKPKKP